MAIVENKGIAGGSLDTRLTTPTRTNAGTPVAALTPAFPGEIVFDSTNRILWQATGTTNAHWMPVSEVL